MATIVKKGKREIEICEFASCIVAGSRRFLKSHECV